MTKSVGVIGLGDMGLAMARNLLAAGFPTSGYDLRRGATGLVRRSRWFARRKPSQTGARCRGRLRDGAERRAGPGRWSAAKTGCWAPYPPARPSSSRPPSIPCELRAIASALAGSGIHLIDCPVSGGRFGAQDGTLILMAAAPAETLDAQRSASIVMVRLGFTPTYTSCARRSRASTDSRE